ncbi:unnamed protein product (macronuclear) [Paramecium tetraurelia]|uniref:Uncharacterized protein n=1 Tax=Paramecium tetraurelia TaxID=5888 RepID=A0CS11_PARTE|nr:uncharacterized protein GSPATT00009850001 [Paramecium tetraurelia]CAK73578.1 unnamed protein product [Paramecium tetraurelia]|eukprot:XP_001440975.1 hypothetical protein (macronuclear) [Paramecium tetraurelia strain d4-2]
MQFTPDTRNVGGRQLILSQLWGHRLCLQQIKERHLNTEIKTSFLKKNENSKLPISTRINDFNMAIHRKKLQNIKECLTDRSNKEPSYFFRRLPSPQSLNSNSMFNKLTMIKSKSTQDKLQNGKIIPPPKIDIDNFIPQNTKTQISWINFINSLHGPQYPLKRWIKQLAIENRIFDENDFAILIRILVKAYQIKQTTLVSLVAEIIEEFEK